MFLSKKSRNFIYTILYLLPIIFSLLWCFVGVFNIFSLNLSFDSENFDTSTFESSISFFYDEVQFSIFNSSFFNFLFLGIYDKVSDATAFFPITTLISFIFDDIVYNNDFVPLFFSFSVYLDYCIWVSVGIISFEVITILPVICRKFFNKLGGF